jgi:predicted MFS family arabinose efflux permease
MLMVALPFHVYAITGSALATSGTIMAHLAPGVLFSSVAGVFVDRWDRKRTMLITSLLQCGAILTLVFVRSDSLFWLIYVVAFVESSLQRFFSPAENALLPALVGEEHLLAANSLNALNDNLARLVGPAIGGALLGLIGFGAVAVVDAVTYAAAALLIVLVQPPQQSREPGAPAAMPEKHWLGVWRQLLDGLEYIRHQPLLRNTFTVIGVALLGDAIISAILVVFIQDELGLSAVEFGWIMTARGIGGLLGGLLVARLGDRWTAAQLTAAGLSAGGLLLLVVLAVPRLSVILPVIALVGITVLMWIVSVQTMLQKNTPDHLRGRVFGTFGMVNMLLMLIGSGFAGLLADRLGSVILMTAAAAIYLAAGLLAVVLLLPLSGENVSHEAASG